MKNPNQNTTTTVLGHVVSGTSQHHILRLLSIFLSHYLIIILRETNKRM
jgi:hypothetical protein